MIDLSIPITFEFFISFANVIAIQPDPVPMSNIFGDLTCLIDLIASSIKRSVSGLGINTLLSTKNSLP